jgi:hypothetical protein
MVNNSWRKVQTLDIHLLVTAHRQLRWDSSCPKHTSFFLSNLYNSSFHSNLPSIGKISGTPTTKKVAEGQRTGARKTCFCQEWDATCADPPSLLSFPFPSTPRLMGHRVQPEKAIRSSYLRIFSPDLLCEHRARRLCSAEKA